MNMKVKNTLFALLTVSVAASATAWDNQKALDAKVDSLNARRGVEIGGSIRAVTQTAMFDTDQDPNGVNHMPETERNEFANADLDFHFRPYESVRANVMLRLGAGMQEYFSSASKTLSVGWVNVEGNIGKSFYWIVGDFRQQYSPLTIYAPSVEVLYEPEIFARKRHMAQQQELLVGNQRNLQGANIQFRGDLGESVGELRAEALFARLNRTAVLDLTGAEGNIMPGGGMAGSTQASNMDKWLVAGNLELLPLSKSLYIGVTPMYIFDNEKSYTYTYRHADDGDTKSDYVLQDINPYDTDAQETMVISARVGADVAQFIGNKNLTLDLVAEYAMSSDKVYNHEMDEAGNNVVTDEKLSGSAILATLNAGFKFSEMFGTALVVDFIRNDSSWFNNVAQSPQFFAQRILNTDKDGNLIRYGVNAPLYSTFDALYNYSPKYAPATTTLATEDGDIQGGATASYNVAPFNKNSWNAHVYTHSQLALLSMLTDPALQLALPNGLATSNRTGVRGILKFEVGNWAEAQGLFSMYNQVSALVGFKEASYTEFGGGAKVDVFKALGFNLPMVISGSYKHSERSMDFDGAMGIVSQTAELKSDFINAGLSVQYLPRLGITGGFQYITTEYNNFEGMLSISAAPLMKGKQMQWMVGLDYTLAPNAWLSINYGIVSVENEYNTGALIGVDSGEAIHFLPDYNDVATTGASSYTHKFTQSVIEASINVEF